MLREACKQFPGRVVLVHEFRTSRVSSARTNVVAGQAESFRMAPHTPTPFSTLALAILQMSFDLCRLAGGCAWWAAWRRDRDVSAALNIRRIAAGLGRPAMPNPGRPCEEWVLVRDRGRKW
ncbi:hypothetical protein HaLaN_27727 [Haematococcus lacustris]|uniref:Uncharacterized protein n=1 Tax=Haematococcus lacustris TaxID=44745 RepID=A0A6A0A8S4_HAELA|nr:hypothetical protein HaLaN_27727 [Haematococcus lacustris]